MVPIDTRMAIGSIGTGIVRRIGVTIIEKTSTVVARTAFAITEIGGHAHMTLPEKSCPAIIAVSVTWASSDTTVICR